MNLCLKIHSQSLNDFQYEDIDTEVNQVLVDIWVKILVFFVSFYCTWEFLCY